MTKRIAHYHSQWSMKRKIKNSIPQEASNNSAQAIAVAILCSRLPNLTNECQLKAVEAFLILAYACFVNLSLHLFFLVISFELIE